jgi:hypothetical protein
MRAHTQAITKNTAHPFCIRQYASFQDKHHLYFLFDLMPGEASVCGLRVGLMVALATHSLFAARQGTQLDFMPGGDVMDVWLRRASSGSTLPNPPY